MRNHVEHAINRRLRASGAASSIPLLSLFTTLETAPNRTISSKTLDFLLQSHWTELDQVGQDWT